MLSTAEAHNHRLVITRFQWMGEKMSHAISGFVFLPNKMTKTVVGRQWMNNARLLSRPSYGCAISMECGTSDSFLATRLDAVSHISHCKLGRAAQELIYVSRHMKWTKSGVSLLGKNFTSWKTFIRCVCLKVLRCLLWKLQHKWVIILFAVSGWGQLTLEPLVQYRF